MFITFPQLANRSKLSLKISHESYPPIGCFEEFFEIWPHLRIVTLKSVPQSCRDLVYPCRKHLFASIRLISPHSSHPRYLICHLPNIE